jgi:Domain of unknown function (DUF4190)
MSHENPPPPSGGGGGYGEQPPGGGYGNQPPPPPPPGGYGQPPYGAPGPSQNSGKAIASLVTGLVGLITFCCGFFVVSSIVAVVLGLLARRDIRASNGALHGDGMALTGIITGVIGIVIFLVGIVLFATGVVDLNYTNDLN